MWGEMIDNPIILIAAIFAGYGILLVGLALLVGPMRRDIAVRAEALLADPSTKPESRERVNMLVDTCMSFHVGLILPVAAFGVLFDELLRRPRPKAHPLHDDPRYLALVGRYFASILAANPLAAIVSVPVIVFCALIGRAFGQESFKEGVEEPLERASVAVGCPA